MGFIVYEIFKFIMVILFVSEMIVNVIQYLERMVDKTVIVFSWSLTCSDTIDPDLRGPRSQEMKSEKQKTTHQ